MLGAIAGDMIGSPYEGKAWFKTKEFPLFSERSHFTDDTVLTVALADSLLTGEPFSRLLKTYFFRYPRAGFGGAFVQWARSSDSRPYNSWGNGSAMRVSPVAWAFDTLDEIVEEAKRSAEATHNHPEGVRGAQAIAAALFLARMRYEKPDIRRQLEETFRYDLSEPLDSVREWATFDVSCQRTVPQALIAFLESDDFEDAVRNAVSLGGDTDTLACMSGSVAHAYYGVPDAIQKEVYARLDAPLLEIVRLFNLRYSL